MNYFGKTSVLAAIALTLSACAGMGLQKAEMMGPSGTEFQKGLYEGYLALSRSEFSEGDYKDSDVFASRAMAVADGEFVGPELIGSRNLPADKVDVMTAARERLMAAMGAGGAAKAPGHAARAQTMFDCWMQEQEENFQPPDIERCRADFFDALGKLEAAVAPEVKPMAKAAPVMAPKRAPDPMIVDGIYIVFFDFDSATLAADAMAIIQQAATDYGKAKPGRISIAANTDTAGAKQYNLGLSERRAAAVIKALSANGVPTSVMTSESFGEMKPMVPTGDGKRERRNRRVEIIFE